jgi:hypothetical protein
MKKHDALFSSIVIISAALFGSVLADSILDALADRGAPVQALPAPATAVQPAAGYDPARTEALRKKFEALGLRPHEGKYWKEVK